MICLVAHGGNEERLRRCCCHIGGIRSGCDFGVNFDDRGML